MRTTNVTISKAARRVTLSLAAILVAACGGDAPLLTADPTGAILFEQGQAELANEDWRRAISAFDTLLRNYPSSPHLAQARLGLGRAYYEQRRVDSLILAVDSFQGFLTYHPSHEQVDYAQYMLGLTYTAQMRTPDRDQAPTRRAIESYDEFIARYPESSYLPEVVALRQKAIDQLAEHEWQVARWQSRRDDDWDAAVDRVKFALENYPDTSLKCELIFTLGEAYRRGEQLEDAAREYERVVSDFPDCEHAEEAGERLRSIRADSR